LCRLERLWHIRIRYIAYCSCRTAVKAKILEKLQDLRSLVKVGTAQCTIWNIVFSPVRCLVVTIPWEFPDEVGNVNKSWKHRRNCCSSLLFINPKKQAQGWCGRIEIKRLSLALISEEESHFSHGERCECPSQCYKTLDATCLRAVIKCECAKLTLQSLQNTSISRVWI